MLKKVISSVCIVITLLVPSLSLALNFSDVPLDSVYELPIHFLRAQGLVTGFPDNTYRPQQSLTRATAARVILSAYENSTRYPLTVPDLNPTSVYPDMKVTDVYAKYMVEAAHLGILPPDADGNYNPQQSITRAQFIKLLIVPSGIDISDLQPQQLYDDVIANSWYTQYMNFAGKYGLILPDQENKLYPSQILSRGEAAEISYALLLIVRADDTILQLTQLQSHIDKTFYFLDQQNLLSAKRNASFASGIGQVLYKADPTNTVFLANAKLAKAVSYIVNYWLIYNYKDADNYKAYWHDLAVNKLNEALAVDPVITPQATQLTNYF